jgi:hypothetical protein
MKVSFYTCLPTQVSNDHESLEKAFGAPRAQSFTREKIRLTRAIRGFFQHIHQPLITNFIEAYQKRKT